MSEFACLKIFNSRNEAELARALLAAEDINSFISADDAGGMIPSLCIMTGGVKLFVLEGDLDKAAVGGTRSRR